MLIERLNRLGVCLLALLALSLNGCTEDAQDAVKKTAEGVESEAGEMADKAGAKASEMGDKASEAMSNLGEEAMGFLGPIKKQLGSLSELKDKPAELKTAVDNILKTIDEKAESIELPESVQKVVDTVKEKLTALKEYLGGDNTDAAGIDQHLKEVNEAASPFSAKE